MAIFTKPRIIGASLAFVLLIGAGFGNAVVTSPLNDQINEASEKLSALQNRRAMLQAAANKESDRTVEEASGLNMQRKSTDDAEITPLFKLITTWSSGDQYRDARTRAMHDFNISKDSSLMSDYMPELSDFTGVDGKKTNQIDVQHVSMEFSNMKSYVTDINADKYSYMTFVTVKGKTLKGDSADGTQVFTYDMNMKHQVSNIRVFNSLK